MRSHTIISRIIVAKISANTSLESVAEYIRTIVEAIDIVQRDPNWMCCIWVEQALGSLRVAGGEFSIIPVVAAGGEVEREIIEFGDGAMTELASGKWNIQHPIRTLICATNNKCVVWFIGSIRKTKEIDL
jgi:hypothetical protein